MLKRLLTLFFFVLGIVTIFAGIGFYLYVKDPLKANNDTYQETLQNNSLAITENGAYFKIQRKVSNPTVGIIFYPGGKVEPEAYVQNMSFLALTKDVTVFVVRMPFNLAVFGINAASTIIANEPNIKDWYIGGHSLGGVMACEYAASHEQQIKGLFLFASYCNRDVSNMQIKVLSISGLNDGLAPRTEIEQNLNKLPHQKTTIFIEGMNHSQFGDYGDQPGDGQASISREEADRQVTLAVGSWL